MAACGNRRRPAPPGYRHNIAMGSLRFTRICVHPTSPGVGCQFGIVYEIRMGKLCILPFCGVRLFGCPRMRRLFDGQIKMPGAVFAAQHKHSLRMVLTSWPCAGWQGDVLCAAGRAVPAAGRITPAEIRPARPLRQSLRAKAAGWALQARHYNLPYQNRPKPARRKTDKPKAEPRFLKKRMQYPPKKVAIDPAR